MAGTRVEAWRVQDTGLVAVPTRFRRLGGLVRHHQGHGAPWPDQVTLEVADGQLRVTGLDGEVGTWPREAVIATRQSSGPPVHFVLEVPGAAHLFAAPARPATDALPARTALLDGELVATDPEGRPSFGLLQQRMHVTTPVEVAARAAEVPIAYVVFDLLHLDGHHLCDVPLTDRRRLLDQVLEPGPRWRVSPLHDDGPALLEAATTRGLEGVVAKRLDSRYEPGKRTRTWLKVKVRLRQEMVVGGWLPGEGNRSGRIGALLVGYHDAPGDGGPLRFAGRVGTGFKDAELTRLAGLFDELATDDCPFDPPPPRAEILRGPRWIRPELVAELEFGEWTHDDRLRHPSYLGLRDDKDPRDVTRDA